MREKEREKSKRAEKEKETNLKIITFIMQEWFNFPLGFM